MRDEDQRVGRLGVRSLARKTAGIVRSFARKMRCVRVDDETRMMEIKPKSIASSDSSETLMSTNAYSASFENLWSGISLHQKHRPESTTRGQIDTHFFGRLPEEIREMIYQELWREAGLGQHIIRTEAGYAHSRCLLHRYDVPGKGGEDPWASMWMAPDARGPVPLWYKREMSTWCDHWKCEEAREEREIWRDIARGRACHCLQIDTWTAFLPMMLTCKRMYLECASSIYKSLSFTITDIALARNLFGVRHRGPEGHPFRRVNLSFRRQADEGNSFECWVESWSVVLRLLDTPGLAAVNLWLDSDIYYERAWLSVAANVLRRVPDALAHKVAVSLPPDGHRDRVAGAVWLRESDLDETSPLAASSPAGPADDKVAEATCFEVRRLRT